jgi:hypothetical protein
VVKSTRTDRRKWSGAVRKGLEGEEACLKTIDQKGSAQEMAKKTLLGTT